ncbi:MAG: hypothetical protein E2P04_00700, partial [Acidobacteria bacterium]
MDNFQGGTIHEYNYETNTIVNSFPTPEPVEGVFGDGLAYAPDRGTLFYTNAAGTKLIYELDANTGAVLNSFDSGDATEGNVANATGLAYGDVIGIGGGVFVAGVDEGCMLGIDPDAPGTVLDGFCFGAGYFPTSATIGAELDGKSQWYVLSYYPAIDVWTASPSPAFVDFFDTPEVDSEGANFAGGLGQVTTPQPGGGDPVVRSYHSTVVTDSIYEYDARIAGTGAIGRGALGNRF